MQPEDPEVRVELKSLTQKRSQIKGAITRFLSFLTKFMENSDKDKKIIELQTRLAATEALWSGFEDVQSRIEILTEFERSDDDREHFENHYFEAISLGKKLVADYQNIQNTAHNSHNNLEPHDFSVVASTSRNIKLPTLELPKFYGDYDKWLYFKDTFVALVDSDKNLNNITKLHYLMSCLKGAAEKTISSLDITEENYRVAWDLLQKRFENKKVIKRTHLKALLDWPSITRESHIHLRKLSDGLSLHLKSLSSLGEPTEQWSTLIVHIFSNKLDPDTKREWEDYSSQIETPTTDDFTEFLSKHCHFLESISNVNSKSYTNKNTQKINQENKYVSHITTFNAQCPLCKAAHYIYKCPSLLKLRGKARVDEIRKIKLCINCLRSSHTTENCTSGGCKHCGRKHNSILHYDDHKPTNEQQSTNNNNSQNIDTNTQDANVSNEVALVNSHCFYSEGTEILLSTALVDIYDKTGNVHTCRVLLDSGSQSNFIRRDLCDILQLNKQPINVPVAGINKMTINISHRTNATIQSKSNAFSINLPFLILDNITEYLPVSKINPNNLLIPNNIKLADPSYHSPGKIDLLIGASVFFELLAIGQIKLGDNQPVLQKTKLGWVISGCISCVDKELTKNKSRPLITHLAINSSTLGDQIEKFWRIENIEHDSHLSQEEMQCEQHFLETTKRDKNGHFIVKLPLRDNLADLGDSHQIALKRFQALEKRFSREQNLKTKYVKFMQEYQQMGHMSLINDPNQVKNSTYYLPHHGVYKETSSTTKLRVVFDASAKTQTDISLNDKLKVGPTVQDELFSILLRFRKHSFVMVADIEKMYRQVFVNEEQRDLQRVLWRDESSQPLQHYKLNTVTYGTASAAFLATRCLRQVGIENQEIYPAASNVILQDFYVDDLLTGAESVESARQIRNDLIKLLDGYGFPLRKWISNNSAILEGDSSINGSSTTHFICDDKVTKTLGILWDSETDMFQYTVNINSTQRVTKRTILSTIAQIFDPLGLIGPVVTKAKIIMQRLWQLRLDWDEAIPADLYTTWIQYYSQIQSLNRLKIHRTIICHNAIKIQLHAFSDSSEQAYGACVYLRSTDMHNSHTVKLLCSKSRVAPLKKISLPRLELCGALLAAQLTDKVIKSLNMKINNIYYWCDSTVAISWIRAEPSDWKTFVANRVSEIQRLTDKNLWRHVSSADNPADIISRGTNPEQLSNLDLWWHSSTWLALDENLWPCHDSQCTLSEMPEKKKCNLTFTIQTVDQDIFYKYSSFTTLQRVVAFCLRFRKNASSHLKNKITGPLSCIELNESLIVLIKVLQNNAFAAEIHALRESQAISSKSKLISLNPFLDNDNLLRVGGRLKRSDLPYDSKHPIILPSNHPFTKLVIIHEHYRHLHAGAQATLYAVRQKYWLINGRSTVRGVLRRCVICFKAKPLDTPYLMGQLPSTRTKPCRPFSITGIDMAGPFFIKDGKCRNRKIVKCYVCVFVCFVTKAMHIELVGDLSTDSFLNALKRMISRRGICHTIFTDNGGNFVGANNELKDLLSKLDKNFKFQEFINQNRINWNFIPPKLPHFGGIWESAVKSAKYHLKRILSNAHLTFEELSTILAQVEAVLNSRPLTPMSSDPNDFLCLTPGHFLIGEPLTAIPQEDVSQMPANRLSQYKRLQQLYQHFWCRWSHEYLTSLHQLTKWKQQHPNALKVGSMVLLREDNLPPMCWKMGRITELFPGQDGVIRVVNVKTCSGVLKRGVAKICVLPIDV